MVTRARMRGFSLVEVIVSMSIFLVFLAIMFSLTTEMRGHEKRLPVNLMQHPQTNALLSRMRKDILSATRYRPAFQEYEAGSSVLILYSLQESGFGNDIVWDFRTPHVAVRRAYSAGALVSEWKARGLPKLAISPVALDGDPPMVSDDLDFENAEGSGRMSSVRLVGKDDADRIAIDQIFQPRAHR